MGPKLFIVSPGVLAGMWLAEIGGIFPVEMGRFLDFKLFLSDSPHSTTSHAGKAKHVGFIVYLCILSFIEIQISLLKVGLWLVDVRLENWGTLLCRGILFFGENSATVGFSM